MCADKLTKFKNYLRTVSEISDEEFQISAHFFQEIFYKKDDFFIKQNQVCKQIGFIIEGTFKIFYSSEEGGNITSCFCRENNFITSYKSYILEKPSELSLQAIENSILFVINKESLNKLYAQSLAWQNIGRKFSEKEYIVIEKYASILNNETAKQKYLRLINEQPSVLTKAKIEDIATYLGVTRRTLSRIRKEIALGN